MVSEITIFKIEQQVKQMAIDNNHNLNEMIIQLNIINDRLDKLEKLKQQ